MPCNPITDAVGCVKDVAGGVVGGVVSSVAGSAWEAVCKSFAEAMVSLLDGFAAAFTAFPSIDPTDPGIRSVYSLSLGIAAVVAAILVLVQITRTALTHDGAGLAHAIVGLGKAVAAFLLTLTVAGAALSAANELTAFIVNHTFNGGDGLKTRLGNAFALTTLGNGSPSLLLLISVVGILLVLVLWFELLLANAAVAVLIGTSPIAAAGQTSALTAPWWPKLVSATAQLIILKPVIALVFAVGFGLAGNATDLAGILSGMLVLLLAVLAWPAIARFFTFATIHLGGGSGLAALLGFTAGRVNGSSAGAGSPGIPPGLAGDDFTAASEQRAMATHAARTRGAAGGASRAAAGGTTGGGAVAAGAAGAGPLLVATAALDAAQRAANALTGRMEQTAGHAGLPGANPHPYPAGYPRHAPVPFPRPAAGGGQPARPGTDDEDVGRSATVNTAWPGNGTRPELETAVPGEAPAGSPHGPASPGNDGPVPGAAGSDPEAASPAPAVVGGRGDHDAPAGASSTGAGPFGTAEGASDQALAASAAPSPVAQPQAAVSTSASTSPAAATGRDPRTVARPAPTQGTAEDAGPGAWSDREPPGSERTP